MPRLAQMLVSGAALALAFAALLWLAAVRPDPELPAPASFLRAEGRDLMRDGAPFRIEAINFTNDYTRTIGEDGFSLDRAAPHSGADFERVRDLGFNSIRFAFNGTWHRDDPAAFWRWLDRNVGWARDHDLLLILDLHMPVGGDWLAPGDGAGDFRIWTDAAIRAETVDLWRRIASRYRDVPAVAAYDILNEAVTSDATGEAWRRLAGEIVSAIREADPNHLLIVGALYGTGGEYRALEAGAQFLVDDPNVLYDVHFYAPVAFTHQTAGWVARPFPGGAVYPDPGRIFPTGREVLLDSIRIETTSPPPGRSGWARYESAWVAVEDPRAVAGLPVAVMRAGARGRVQFDAIEVTEFDPVRGTVTTVVRAPLSAETLDDWWSWARAGARANDQSFARVTTDGVNDGASLRIDGATGPEDFLGWSSDAHWVRVTPGHRYRVAGFIKGEGVGRAGGPEASIGLALDIYADPPDAPGGGFSGWDRGFLDTRLRALLAFGEAHDVPMSVMEFGTHRASFEALGGPGRGGEDWVADVLSLLDERGVSFAYWAYDDPAMGLDARGGNAGPAASNAALIEVLARHLGRSGS